ncbi:MAG: hypothetical protein HQL54_09280 [Magnetococcales bacterium]|nr:hypothetical protein [Magnetococcales bacterium]
MNAWKQALSDWILADKYIENKESIQISEENEDGKARLLILSNNKIIHLLRKDNDKIPFLANKACADGILIEFIGNYPVAIHIVELKRTISTKSWNTIRKQFIGALGYTRAFLGVLGLPAPKNIHCYTAFYRDKLASRENPDPIFERPFTGVPITPETTPTLFWETRTLSIFSEEAKHHKIQWDWKEDTEHTHTLSPSEHT